MEQDMTWSNIQSKIWTEDNEVPQGVQSLSSPSVPYLRQAKQRRIFPWWQRKLPHHDRPNFLALCHRNPLLLESPKAGNISEMNATSTWSRNSFENVMQRIHLWYSGWRVVSLHLQWIRSRVDTRKRNYYSVHAKKLENVMNLYTLRRSKT